jgi:hypothetical protein
MGLGYWLAAGKLMMKKKQEALQLLHGLESLMGLSMIDAPDGNLPNMTVVTMESI